MIDADELPSDWEATTVKDLCGQPQYGYTESATHDAVGPKFLRITDIQDGEVNWDSVPFCPCDDTPKYRLVDGDILFARTGATTGKSYLVHNPPEAVFASYLIRIRPGTRVLPEYVWWYFQSSGYWASVFGGIDDGNRPNMNGTKLAALRVPFPNSKTEQRRLVARIEALTSRLEKARQARQAALVEAETLRQSLLDEAFATVPENRWQALGTHARIQGGYAFKSGWFASAGIRLLRNQNVSHGTVEWSDSVHLPPERRGEFSAYELRLGDIVISMDRPLISTGLKAARIGAEDLPCLLLQRVGRFQFKEGLSRDYLFHFLMSQAFTIHISGDGRSSAVPHISAKQIEGIRIPIPTPSEQRRIVARLEALGAHQAELRRLQLETESELAAFTPAVLAKAFRGEL